MKQNIFVKILSMLLVICFLSAGISALGIEVFAEEEDLTYDISSSGSLIATLTKQGGGYKLTISGSGSMKGWSSPSSVPWYDYRNEIIEIVIEDGITNIGSYAFKGCKITDLTIPNSIRAIDYEGVSYCSNLRSLTIGSGTVGIHISAFSGNKNLTSISVNASNPYYYSKGNCIIEKATKEVVLGCRSSNIPSEVKRIGSSAFSNQYEMGSISIPNGVEVIEDYAFRKCWSLKSISIPDSVIEIEEGAFSGCRELTNVTFGTNSQLKKIGSRVFENCDLLKNLVLPDNIDNGGTIDEAALKQQLASKLENINFGPYALQVGEFHLPFWKDPLYLIDDLEVSIKVNLSDSTAFQIVSTENNTIQVLYGFNQDESANIQGSEASPTYWSEAYQEVKDLYQNVVGKKVTTPKLWNEFSKLRGGLKKVKFSMGLEVDGYLAGFIEFDKKNLQPISGGMVAIVDTHTDIRMASLAGGLLTAGITIHANTTGKIGFSLEDLFYIDTSLYIGAGPYLKAGIGDVAYVRGEVTGGFRFDFSTKSDSSPFEAFLDLKGGFKVKALFVERELEFDLPEHQIWPKVETNVALLSLTNELTNASDYNNFINSASAIDRSYLRTTYSLRGGNISNYSDINFKKSNSYTWNGVKLVSFDDNTMLLVWIDDTGEKSDENMCSLYYSYYDGTNWSLPAVVYEDGTMSDTPSVYSDGEYAYIVWSKANQVFGSDMETSDMMQYFDLYTTVFDSKTQAFSNPVCITSQEENLFEINPKIYGSNGAYTVTWIENTDNNIFQLSGINTLKMAKIDNSGNVIEIKEIENGEKAIDLARIYGADKMFYSVLESDNVNLYLYDGAESSLIATNVKCFDYANGHLFYSTSEGFYVYDFVNTVCYDELNGLDSFTVTYNTGKYIFTTSATNEDFTRTIYYGTLFLDESGYDWSGFSVYLDTDCSVWEFSPVVLSDGSVYMAFNMVEENEETGVEFSNIVVSGCTDKVDIVLEYVDFEDEQLKTGEFELQLMVQNNSSEIFTAFDVYILDEAGNAVHTETVKRRLTAFGSLELTVDYNIPDDYAGEIYTIKVFPAGFEELNEKNNSVQTTFTCGIHDFSAGWIVDVVPTRETTGWVSHYCENCGLVFDKTEVPCLGFSNASVTLQDDLTINYKVDASAFEQYTNPYVKFVMGDQEIIVRDYTVADGKYVFKFSNIAPHKINDTVYATLYAEFNEVEVNSVTREYSVATYCYNMLEKYSGNEYMSLRRLLVDLLDYGAQSQLYVGYCTDELANEKLTETQKKWGTADERILSTKQHIKYKTIENPTVAWKSAGLKLEDSVAMRFKLAATDITGLVVKVTDAYGNKWNITSDQFKETADGYYYVYFDKFNADQMSEVVYLTVYEGNVAVSHTIRYSIESYAYSKQNDTNEALAELVKAMMQYGDSAYAYVHSTTDGIDDIGQSGDDIFDGYWTPWI